MKSTMMAVPLSTNTMFARMDKLFGQSEVISRLPDKRLVRHSFTEIAARTRALAHALKELGIKKGDCVATLCWNHNVHLECYFGIPLAGAVMHFVRGQTNKQAARALGGTERTIKAHRQRVMEKMQVQSLAEFVSLGMSLLVAQMRSAAMSAIPPLLGNKRK